MQVKHKESGIIGVVVPDFFNLAGNDHCMVDFDGDTSIVACEISDLEPLGQIEINFSRSKCQNCVFANNACHRYDNSRMGWLLSLGAKKHVPERTYPYCQD